MGTNVRVEAPGTPQNGQIMPFGEAFRWGVGRALGQGMGTPTPSIAPVPPLVTPIKTVVKPEPGLAMPAADGGGARTLGGA